VLCASSPNTEPNEGIGTNVRELLCMLALSAVRGWVRDGSSTLEALRDTAPKTVKDDELSMEEGLSAGSCQHCLLLWSSLY
jgi:hypothetical protein